MANETKVALVIDADTGLPEVSPLTAADIPLKTALDVRREQSRVYREARAGKLDRQDAAKLVWMLGEIRKSIETHDIEQRLTELEGRTSNKALPQPARAH